MFRVGDRVRKTQPYFTNLVPDPHGVNIGNTGTIIGILRNKYMVQFDGKAFAAAIDYAYEEASLEPIIRLLRKRRSLLRKRRSMKRQ
jgi:hypothetical protein